VLLQQFLTEGDVVSGLQSGGDLAAELQAGTAGSSLRFERFLPVVLVERE
jgi:hypothetical protein